MSLRDLSIRPTYDTSDPEIDPVSEFLEPCLESSIKYDRLSGYFSSQVLSLAAKGLCDFLDGNGHMRLLMSSALNPVDFSFLENALRENLNYEHLFGELSFSSESMVSLVSRRHLEAMCWLLSQNRLEIRVVTYQGDASLNHTPIFHPKVGIFSDLDGNKISFSGSINETISGWTENSEEFKVFKSWDDATSGFVLQDEYVFNKFWNQESNGNFRTIPLPEAIRDKLILQAPLDKPNIRNGNGNSKKSPKVSLMLRDYQQSAVSSWVEAEFKGILEMATGTGKTKTAKACIEKVLERGSTISVVTAPYEHIAKQWMKELSELKPILASGNTGWHGDIGDALNKRKLDRISNLSIIAVQNTASSQKFIDLINASLDLFENSLFVGDEVHGLGATSFQSALNANIEYRLGLSATPVRHFDEIGTEILKDYFSGTCFVFDTTEALNWRDPTSGAKALSPYRYFNTFVTLNDAEISEFRKITDELSRIFDADADFEKQKIKEMLLFKRAAIVKKASAKIPALKKLLENLNEDLQFALIYCHDFDQLADVANILEVMNISFQKITGDESNVPSKDYQYLSEREWILRNFNKGTTKVLLAIKCLDEGVDIPAARIGIILASSGNPREFIQRRGRLLRPNLNKEFAILHDFVVSPNVKSSNGNHFDMELDTFKKEMQRIEEFAKDSINADLVNNEIAKKLIEMSING